MKLKTRGIRPRCFAVLFLFTTLVVPQAMAGEKSESTAMILGLDPLPADALIYTGRYGEAAANILVGGTGIGLLAYGVSQLLSDNEFDQGIGLTFALAGATAYVPALLGDYFGARDALKKSPQRKSYTASLLMAFDPFPGDALYYAGKPYSALGSTLLGTLGALGFYGGLIAVSGLNCSSGAEASDVSGLCDWGKGIGYTMMVMGGATYLSSLLWDGIAGVHGVYEHNQKVAQETKPLAWIPRPFITMAGDGLLAGVSGRY